MGIAVTHTKLDQIYREVLGDFRDDKEFLWKHRGGFVHFIQMAIAEGHLGPEYARKHFKLERLSYALEPGCDQLLTNETVANLAEHDLLRDADGQILETPQYYWMRRAMADSLHSPNPTREALKLYEVYSTAGEVVPEKPYGEGIFNNQRLLFDVTRPVAGAGSREIPDHYREHGWVVIDNVADEFEAIRVQENFLNSAGVRTQLAKADQIPVCDDIVATSFQVLHFDMGHPLVESPGQLFVSHVGIYLPKTIDYEVTAATRVVELPGLLGHLHESPETVESNLTNYVRRYGDGWTGHNSLRLAAFVRFLDAMSEKPELTQEVDKTVGQWFGTERSGEDEAYRQEADFFAKHGIALDLVEHQVRLAPGQLLILDNSRVVHGRIGKRREKELFNYMWGVPTLASEEIALLRATICRQVAG